MDDPAGENKSAGGPEERLGSGRCIQWPDTPEVGSSEPTTHREANVKIGPSVKIKGTLTAQEDLTIEGGFEGKISVKDHVLTIGPEGHIEAEIHGKSVVVGGKVTGNIIADDKVEITARGSVQGDIRSARLAIADGARLSGHLDMGDSAAKPAERAEGSSAAAAIPQGKSAAAR